MMQYTGYMNLLEHYHNYLTINILWKYWNRSLKTVIFSSLTWLFSVYDKITINKRLFQYFQRRCNVQYVQFYSPYGTRQSSYLFLQLGAYEIRRKPSFLPSVCVYYTLITVALLLPPVLTRRVLEVSSLISSPPASLKSVTTSTKWPNFSTLTSLWALTPTEKRPIHCRPTHSSFSSWRLAGMYISVYFYSMRLCEEEFFSLLCRRRLLRMWTFWALLKVPK